MVAGASNVISCVDQLRNNDTSGVHHLNLSALEVALLIYLDYTKHIIIHYCEKFEPLSTQRSD